ncbi:MAG: carbonic anhydrase [Candidatus Eisenbacteria bacterium]
MSFCTVINCMDGRVQLPVITYLQENLGVKYVDSVTEPGPVGILAERTDAPAVDSILRRVAISTGAHNSSAVAVVVVAHHDCGGNPADEATQRVQLTKALDFVSQNVPGVLVLGLWVDGNWSVSEAERREPSAAA